MSEIRYDIIHDDYVIISPERLHRPNYYSKQNRNLSEELSKCPFCEGHEHLTPPEIYAIRNNQPNTAGWKVRVIPNLYKAVQIETPLTFKNDEIYLAAGGYGAHEIIIDTPRHITQLNKLTKDEIFNWLNVIKCRVADLQNDKKLKHVSVFKNHGFYAGATQSHPHTQLIATPVMPKSRLNLLNNCFNFFKNNSKNIFDLIIERETENDRLITQNECFIAFAPFASKFAFEVIIASKIASTPSIIDLNDAALNKLAKILKTVITAMYKQLEDFDFNLIFCIPPINKTKETEQFFGLFEKFFRFHIRITPRIFGIGGFEIESGIFINPVSPEEAAHFLKTSIGGL
ncbi:galactose-1-phosphate uridylyltransferase [Hippea jasoniae]|uniref:galactose-1-phosphate uridylyltransferase n=1 Tax=Hippea jasoniae TaxID=944479 RepID=UPI0005513690|nr:DUF4931 domain-containing protein [Hippea jasoniae]